MRLNIREEGYDRRLAIIRVTHLLYERVYFTTTFCNLFRDAAAGKLIFNILNNLIVFSPHEGITGVVHTVACTTSLVSQREV